MKVVGPQEKIMLSHNRRLIRAAGIFLALAFLSTNSSLAAITCTDSGDGKKCIASYCYGSGTTCVTQIACTISQILSTSSSPTFNQITVNPQRRITKILLQPNISGYSSETYLEMYKIVGGIKTSKVLKVRGSTEPVKIEYDVTDVFGQTDINGTYYIYVSENYTSQNNNCANLGTYNLIIDYECPNDIGCDNVPDVPKMAFSPASYNYNSVSIGQKSASATYTISNSGKSNFTVKEVTKSGSNPGEFHKVADNCTGKTLDFHSGANNSCTFQYQFSPETPGAKSASLLILTDIFKNAQSTIAVSGQATTVQKIQVVPGTDIFQQIPAGVTSSPHIYTVTNTGPGSLQIGNLGITGINSADFKVSNDQCSGRTLSSKAICTFQTVFRPASQGNKSSSITIPSDDQSAGVLSVPLTGAATAASISYCN